MNFELADIRILRLVHHNRIEALDGLLYAVSVMTTFISIGLVLFILFYSLWKRSEQFRIIFYKMAAVLVVAALISLSIKNLVIRERPFVIYPDIEKLSAAGSSSFPSGHTLEVFALAVALSILIPKKKVIIPIFIWAALVAYSRMALGVHYPGDVLGGMLIGAFTGWLVTWLANHFHPNFKKEKSNY